MPHKQIKKAASALKQTAVGVGQAVADNVPIRPSGGFEAGFRRVGQTPAIVYREPLAPLGLLPSPKQAVRNTTATVRNPTPGNVFRTASDILSAAALVTPVRVTSVGARVPALASETGALRLGPKAARAAKASGFVDEAGPSFVEFAQKAGPFTKRAATSGPRLRTAAELAANPRSFVNAARAARAAAQESISAADKIAAPTQEAVRVPFTLRFEKPAQEAAQVVEKAAPAASKSRLGGLAAKAGRLATSPVKGVGVDISRIKEASGVRGKAGAIAGGGARLVFGDVAGDIKTGASRIRQAQGVRGTAGAIAKAGVRGTLTGGRAAVGGTIAYFAAKEPVNQIRGKSTEAAFNRNPSAVESYNAFARVRAKKGQAGIDALTLGLYAAKQEAGGDLSKLSDSALKKLLRSKVKAAYSGTSKLKYAS